jgi:hypothetical protein
VVAIGKDSTVGSSLPLGTLRPELRAAPWERGKAFGRSAPIAPLRKVEADIDMTGTPAGVGAIVPGHRDTGGIDDLKRDRH